MDDAEIGKRLRAHRKARSLTQTDIEAKTGINTGNLSKIENGKQSLTNATMKALADAYGMTLGELFDEARAQGVGIGNNSASDAGNRYQVVSSYEKLINIPQDENVAIGTIAVRPDAAHGGVQISVDTSRFHVFHGGAIRELDSEPQNLASFEIEDDMMAPRLFKTDTVVVDLAETTIPPTGGVFGVVLDGECVAFRRILPYVNKGLRIICDNPAYPEITLNAQQVHAITIVGRVKHRRGNEGF